MNQQLHLPIDDADGPAPGPAGAPGLPRATDGGRPFDDDAFFFEPWWPGTQAFLRHGGGVPSRCAPST